MKKVLKSVKLFLLVAVLLSQVILINLPVNAWVGMPAISKLHVSGNQLVNPSGQPVVLSGWFQPTAPFWTYQGSNYYLNLNGNNEHAAVLAFLKDITDTVTDTSPRYGSSHGWYMNFVRTCIDVDYLGDVAAGTYNFAGLQTYTQDILIPYINYARTKGVYVTIDLNFTFTDGQCTTPENLEKFKEIWGYLASQPEIKSADNVMFELINEPVCSYANGHWGARDWDDYADHWNALKDFQNSIIQTIRNTGADNVIWCAGLGWDQHYDLAAQYPITDPLNNYGYAVHWYPGYGANDDMDKLQQIWDDTIAPCAAAYPICITETVWFKYLEGDPEYGHLFDGTNAGFGKNTKKIFTAAGNVSMVGGACGDLFEPGIRSTNGDPTAGLKYDGNTVRDGMARFIFDWFYERAQSYPNNGISNGIVSGATYKIINRNSGKAIDVPLGQNISGLQLQQWSDNGLNTQQWVATDIGGGNYRLASVCAPGKVIDVNNGTKNNGEKIQLMDDWGNTAQRFTIHSLGNGYCSIINVNSNRCVEVTDSLTGDGALLVQNLYAGNNDQQWQFVRISPVKRFESYNFPGNFIRHAAFIGRLDANVSPVEDSQFKVVAGLADGIGISLESVNFPGYYLRHSGFQLYVQQNDGSDGFKADATFYRQTGFKDANGFSYKSYNFPDRFIRHADNLLYIQPISTDLDKSDATFYER